MAQATNGGVYEKAGFAPEEADRAAATVLLFVLGHALGPAAEVSLTRRLDTEAGPNSEWPSVTGLI